MTTNNTLAERGGAKARRIPPGGAPDAEVAALMEELSRLQTWTVMLMCKQMPGAQEAGDLVQRTRCLIVERLYPANLGTTVQAPNERKGEEGHTSPRAGILLPERRADDPLDPAEGVSMSAHK